MRYATIENGEVVNVYVADESHDGIQVEPRVAIGDTAELVDGQWVFTPQPVVELELSPEEQAALVRWERDRLLAASDWTQIADAPVVSLEWQPYRQALRDVPQQSGFPDDVEWPTPPNE